MTDQSIAARETPTRVQGFAAAFSAAVATMVLAGWASGVDILTQVLPGAIAMNPATSVGVLALSLGLVCRSRRCGPIVRVLAGIAIAIGAIKFFQFLLDTEGGIDRILFAGELDRVAGGPNRMAPNTAFALAALGCGLLWSGSRDPGKVVHSQIACVVSATIAMIAAIGYALNLAALYQLHDYIAMALPTTIVLIILSLAVFSINPHLGLARIVADRGPAGLLARTALPFALLVPLTIGVLDRAGQHAGLYGAEAGSALALMVNVVVNFLLLGGCIIALFASDAERKRREAAIAASERQYREAERVGRVGYWTFDAATRAVQWSNGFVQICGIPPDTAPSIEAIIGACHPDDAALAAEFITRSDCQNWQFQCRVQHPDGTVRHVRSHGVCDTPEDGSPGTILGVFSDITELEVARQAAERAKDTTASFLANMSHEIRTPMNGVMGFVELLLRGDLSDAQRRHLGLIQDSAQALLKLLNDILDISKIEAGRLEIASAPYNIRHGITQCVRLMTPIAEQKNLALTLDLADEVPPSLVVDGLRVRQILLNLVGNAVKFTTCGTVAVRVSRASGRGGEAMLQIAVSDTGVGVPADRLATIFDPFVQAEASTTRRFGGSGLGLSISRSLANMMGGAIRAESTLGQGTSVTLLLPWVEVDRPRAGKGRAQSVAPAAARKPDRRGASVLLIEDVDINRELFAEMLTALGHRFDLGEDGAQALELARQLKDEPHKWDLVLMDLQMPVMDGLSATRAIRALGGRAATIPIVALTASAFEEEVRECHAAGMNDHLAKPVSIDGLGMIVERWRGDARGKPDRRVARPPAAASLTDKFAVKREEARARLAQIVIELGTASHDQERRLSGEAQQFAHFLAGCAGMFGEPALGELASKSEHQLANAGSGVSANDTRRKTIQALIDAMEKPRPGTAEATRRLKA